ncbi:MAG: hypothetical protein AB4290_17620 [Spirulina sp.]
MSEENSQTQDANQPSLYSKSAAIEPRSLEKDADALMDDLFSEIDILLEGSGQLPAKPAKAEYVTLQSVVVPSITLPTPEQKSREEKAKPSQKKAKSRSRFSLKKNKTQKEVKSVPKKTLSSFQLGRHADKILFGIACCSLLGVGIWLFSLWQLQSNTSSPEPPLPEPQNEAQTPSIPPGQDAPFIQYMLRSLAAIARQPEMPQVRQTASMPTPTSDRATETPSNSTTSPQVIERVYIPVYPPNPNTATPNSLSEAIAPPPPSPERSQPNASSSPTPVNAGETTLPNPPDESLSAAREDGLPNFDETEIPRESFDNAPVPPQYNIKLAGVLESGENSGALFRIDNATQRIQLGEAIGTSGWTLIGIEGQTAVIRRNGEIRSIYVGQTF